VAGTFTNGETKKLFKVAIAIFQNPRGLESISGSLLRTTDQSGQALIKEPGVSGTGRIVSGALEGSATDIATEFSAMIVAQRAFQANSKVITTVDQMLNDLLQLR
jgi:flagellar hook protein FlgE